MACFCGLKTLVLVFPRQIKILQATGLPQHLSNFVFCQYTFWDQPEPVMVAPEVDMPSSSAIAKDPHCMVVFDSCKVGRRTSACRAVPGCDRVLVG